MYKKIVLIFLIISSFILINPLKCFATNINKKILIIGSYSSENKWEISILEGFDNNNDKYIVKWEFLDSKVSESKEYDDSFINFLNIKYRDANIDYIITLDDEAFRVVRDNLFNKDIVYI